LRPVRNIGSDNLDVHGIGIVTDDVQKKLKTVCSYHTATDKHSSVARIFFNDSPVENGLKDMLTLKTFF